MRLCLRVYCCATQNVIVNLVAVSSTLEAFVRKYSIVFALSPMISCRLLYLLALMNLSAQLGCVRGESTRNPAMSCQMRNAVKHSVEIKQMGKHPCSHTAQMW